MQQRQEQIEETTESRATEIRLVSDECLVVRNYDGDEGYTVEVEFLDAADEVAYSREIRVEPLECIVFESRLARDVYRIQARIDTGQSAAATCLVGSGPQETALVEMGNRTISVVEGFENGR